MRHPIRALLFLLLLAAPLFYSGCSKDPSITAYKTQNVVIVVVDGARYTETWGDSGRRFIPHRAAMLQQGVMCANFYDNGFCYTNAGHTAITTGFYQSINNSGTEYPLYPSMFQVWLGMYHKPASDAWVITTKDKLEILSDCNDPNWHGKYRPMTNCGVAGLGTGYREDSTTLRNAKTIIAANHPRLVLINFKQPDAAGHMGDSLSYLQGIVDTDNYIYQLWEQLQSDNFYKNKTTLIVTNDHGRHTAGHLDGFVSHGDFCEGCRHIEFFAMGPDFKRNYECLQKHDQVDIAATVAELMSIQMPHGQGNVLRELFK